MMFNLAGSSLARIDISFLLMDSGNVFMLYSYCMSAVIIALSLAGIAAGRFPVLRMNRSTIAFTGAVLLVLAGGITYEEALSSVDLNTIVLIFAMMVINSNLRLSGFFRLAGRLICRNAETPGSLLAWIIVISAFLSAIFLNDTIVLMMTPLVIEIAVIASRNPVPYLVALAVSANIGSAATFIGNPQNILIGAVSGIPFFSYTLTALVPSAFGLAVSWLVIKLVFRKEFDKTRFMIDVSQGTAVYRPLLYKCLVSVALLAACIVSGMPVAPAALAAAALLAVTRRINPVRVFSDMDFSILVFFSGLFVITGALSRLDFYSYLVLGSGRLVAGNIPVFSVVSMVLSNLVSNVPAVMLLRPVVELSASKDIMWTALALSSTYAGNLTLLGSVANLIVAETAARANITLSFTDYLKAGLPVTIITVAGGAAWVMFAG